MPLGGPATISRETDRGRAVILDDDFADSRMVVAQQGHHVFGVCALSEASEAA